MRRGLAVMMWFLLAGLAVVGEAGAEADYFVLTQWGSVYRNAQQVAHKKYQRPFQVAGTPAAVFVATYDGVKTVIYKNGQVVGADACPEQSPKAMDACGDDWYVLTTKGAVIKNGQVVAEAGTFAYPADIAAVGADYYVVTGQGWIFRNKEKIHEYSYDGDPKCLAVNGTDLWVTTGRGSVYKGDQCVEKEGYGNVVAVGVDGGNYYVFTATGSVYRNGEKTGAVALDKDELGKPDNICDVDMPSPQ